MDSNYYISGDSILNHISTLQYFPDKGYYDNWIKNFSLEKNNVNNINEINKERLIFITKIEYLNEFYNKIVKFLKSKFVLITHYGDFNSGVHDKLLNHPLLIKWYGQNMSVISCKTQGIPIGLENEYWKRTNNLILKKNCNNNKENLLYLNFSLRTHRKRYRIMKSLKRKGFKKNDKLPWNKYIEDLSTHKFCISPRGNGVDCHRTWECLYLGVIPIVEKSVQMEYFNDLPILFVDNYDNISVEFLNQKYDEFKNKSFNLDKLSLSYWITKINNEF